MNELNRKIFGGQGYYYEEDIKVFFFLAKGEMKFSNRFDDGISKDTTIIWTSTYHLSSFLSVVFPTFSCSIALAGF